MRSQCPMPEDCRPARSNLTMSESSNSDDLGHYLYPRVDLFAPLNLRIVFFAGGLGAITERSS
jgi:hypothetical protein